LAAIVDFSEKLYDVKDDISDASTGLKNLFSQGKSVNTMLQGIQAINTESLPDGMTKEAAEVIKKYTGAIDVVNYDSEEGNKAINAVTKLVNMAK
jgi:hypothetical protein